VLAKTFVLELLIAKLLEDKRSEKLSDQLLHVWTEMRDHSTDLAVEDPANPNGNDLTPLLEECRASLSSASATTLANIELLGWDSVFGEVEDDDDGGGSGKTKKAFALSSATAAVSRPTKPWAE
jgi:hypothetical protein